MSNVPPGQRQLWLMIASSMAMAMVIYAIVISFIRESPGTSVDAPEPPRHLFWAGAALVAVASIAHTQFRLRKPIRDAATSVPPGELPAFPDFQTRSIVSLALAETAGIVGFLQATMYRTPVRDYVPFGLLGLAVIVADVIPVGLGYFREAERRAGASSGAPVG